MGMTKKTRFEVFKRDKFTCQYCGQSAPNVVLHVDHIQPVSKEGEDDIVNLITACFDCNMGKKDRELSDDAVIQKRKKQLDDLQDRREQLEMMAEWQRSLIDLDEEAVGKASEFWNDLAGGYEINEHGAKLLRQWIGRHGFQQVLEAIRTSMTTYLKEDENGRYTKDSVHKAFDYIPKICANQKRLATKPYLKDLYYIRGIMRNRLHYLTEWKALEMMEAAYLAGVDIDDIKQVAFDSKNWTEWQANIIAITNSPKTTNEQP